MPEESEETAIDHPYDVLPHYETSDQSALSPSALSRKKPHHREAQDGTSNRRDLLQRLLVNLFLAQPRKKPLGEIEEQSTGEGMHEQK